MSGAHAAAVPTACSRIVPAARPRPAPSRPGLAEALQVSERTIYRDVAAWAAPASRSAAKPVWSYLMRPGYRLPLMLDAEELAALAWAAAPGVRARPARWVVRPSFLPFGTHRIRALRRQDPAQDALLVPASIPETTRAHGGPAGRASRLIAKCALPTRADGLASQRVIHPLGLVFWETWTTSAPGASCAAASGLPPRPDRRAHPLDDAFDGTGMLVRYLASVQQEDGQDSPVLRRRGATRVHEHAPHAEFAPLPFSTPAPMSTSDAALHRLRAYARPLPSFYWAEAEARGLPWYPPPKRSTPGSSCMAGTNQGRPHCVALQGQVGRSGELLSLPATPDTAAVSSRACAMPESTGEGYGLDSIKPRMTFICKR